VASKHTQANKSFGGRCQQQQQQQQQQWQQEHQKG